MEINYKSISLEVEIHKKVTSLMCLHISGVCVYIYIYCELELDLILVFFFFFGINRI